MRIDIPRNGIHDKVWCSSFALVLATDFLPKDKRHTASRTSVRRTISISNWASEVSRGGAGADGARSIGRSTLPLTKETDVPDGKSRTKGVTAISPREPR